MLPSLARSSQALAGSSSSQIPSSPRPDPGTGAGGNVIFEPRSTAMKTISVEPVEIRAAARRALTTCDEFASRDEDQNHGAADLLSRPNPDQWAVAAVGGRAVLRTSPARLHHGSGGGEPGGILSVTDRRSLSRLISAYLRLSAPGRDAARATAQGRGHGAPGPRRV